MLPPKSSAPVLPDPDEVLLTTADLARRWGISERTLKYWRDAGGGPAYLKLGQAVRYRLADILIHEDCAVVAA